LVTTYLLVTTFWAVSITNDLFQNRSALHHTVLSYLLE
jgi:hypothetical protein